MRALLFLFLIPFGSGVHQYLYVPYFPGYSDVYPYQLATYSTIANALTRNNVGDIIANTRFFSNQLQAILQQFADNPTSAAIVNKIINEKDDICIGNLEDGIAAIDAPTKLLERTGDDIKNLIAKVNSILDLTDPASVLRVVAEILQIIEPVKIQWTNAFNNIFQNNPSLCAASPEQASVSLRSLASLVNELSTTNQLAIGRVERIKLMDAGRKILAINTILDRLRSTFTRIGQICTPDRQYNTQAISSLGDLMVDLADLFQSLGGEKQGVKISKGKDFVNKVVGQLNKIENLGISNYDCSKQDDFSYVASIMEDLAKIIDEVGIKQLESQLGVDLSSVFDQ